MFKEWIKTLRRYFQKANGVLAKDINGKPFSKGSQWIYKLSFWIIACAVVCFLPKGLSDGFIDYIKDIFAIFVGFFVTVLCFVFDKLDTRRILSEEERNALPAEQRGSALDNVKLYGKVFLYDRTDNSVFYSGNTTAGSQYLLGRLVQP